eukprot:2084186-Rhodomonas_salina.1
MMGAGVRPVVLLQAVTQSSILQTLWQAYDRAEPIAAALTGAWIVVCDLEAAEPLQHHCRPCSSEGGLRRSRVEHAESEDSAESASGHGQRTQVLLETHAGDQAQVRKSHKRPNACTAARLPARFSKLVPAH